MSAVWLVKYFQETSEISGMAASISDMAKVMAVSIKNRYLTVRSGPRADLEVLVNQVNTLASVATDAKEVIEIRKERMESAHWIVLRVEKVSETIVDADGRVERLRQPTELPICELLSLEELGAARSRAMRERIMDCFYTPEELKFMDMKRVLEGFDVYELILPAGEKLLQLLIMVQKLINCSVDVVKYLEKVAGDDEDLGDGGAVQLLETGMENLVMIATDVGNEDLGDGAVQLLETGMENLVMIATDVGNEDLGDGAVQLLETGMENLVMIATDLANEAAAACQMVMNACPPKLS